MKILNSYKYISLALVLGIYLGACSPSKPAETTAEEPSKDGVSVDSLQAKNIGLTLTKFEVKDIRAHLKVKGKIDVPPQNMYSLSLPLGGYLKYTKLLPGMHFNKGDVIALIEDPKFIEIQQQYLVAKSKQQLLKADFERQNTLFEAKAVSEKVFQQVKSDYQTQQVTLRALEEQLKLIGINPLTLTAENLSGTIPLRAPINGFVGRVNANTGKYFSPTDVLFELVNPEDIHLSLNVFEKDINELEIGQKVTAFTNAASQKKYTCEIILIGKEVLEDNSVNVHCHFDSYYNKLVPGTYMNAEINKVYKAAFTLPETAIQYWEAKPVIFIKEGEGFKMQTVELGVSENGFVQIISPEASWLQASIADKGSYALLMKLKNAAEEE
jgi:cobalt-zinc-cadmium efflux system membrane fusion protein